MDNQSMNNELQIEQNIEQKQLVVVYNAYTNEIEYEYTTEMEPEIFPMPDSDGYVTGNFTVFYLSGYEEEDGTDYTECDYNDRYYARVFNVA